MWQLQKRLLSMVGMSNTHLLYNTAILYDLKLNQSGPKKVNARRIANT